MYARPTTAVRPGVPKRWVCSSPTSASRVRLKRRDRAAVLAQVAVRLAQPDVGQGLESEIADRPGDGQCPFARRGSVFRAAC